jgi:hypothetical protein
VLDRESPLPQTALGSAWAMTRTLALAVSIALMRSDAHGAAPQARPTPPPAAAGIVSRSAPLMSAGTK